VCMHKGTHRLPAQRAQDPHPVLDRAANQRALFSFYCQIAERDLGWFPVPPTLLTFVSSCAQIESQQRSFLFGATVRRPIRRIRDRIEPGPSTKVMTHELRCCELNHRLRIVHVFLERQKSGKRLDAGMVRAAEFGGALRTCVRSWGKVRLSRT